MSVHVTIDLPEASLSILRTTLAAFVQELRLAAAVKWYEIGKISQAKAAELAGLSRAQFLKALGLFNVSPYQITPENLAAEVGGVPERLSFPLANIEHAHLLPDSCDRMIIPRAVEKRE